MEETPVSVTQEDFNKHILEEAIPMKVKEGPC